MQFVRVLIVELSENCIFFAVLQDTFVKSFICLWCSFVFGTSDFRNNEIDYSRSNLRELFIQFVKVNLLYLYFLFHMWTLDIIAQLLI